MKEINEVVGINLKKLRTEKGLTLDQLAEETGVSKSMICDIERGSKSPTISVLWKICNGIRVPFSELMKTETSDVTVVKNDKIIHCTIQEGVELFALFPYDEAKRFEVCRLEIMPHSVYKSEKHFGKMREYCIAVKGQLKMGVDSEEFTVNEGEAILFIASVDHSYINDTNETIKVLVIMYYE